jgi:hypothetical protein
MKKMRSILVIGSVLALWMPVQAKDKKTKAAPKDPQDEITVVGQIPLSGGPVLRFLTTEHYSSHYLYAEHGSGSVTLIDVTRMTKPTVLSDLSYSPGNLFAVAGTAALVAEQPQTAGASTTPKALRIMDFSDPKNPRVAREFPGVTAVSRDDRRGLIFVANGEGVWILHQNYAEDPEVEKAYAHHVLYDH